MKKQPNAIILEIPIRPRPSKDQYELEKCRRAYNEGNVIAIWRALTLCRKAPLPDWLYLAMLEILDRHLKSMRGGKGRHARWYEQRKQEVVDFLAYGTVRALRNNGIRGERAYEEAVKILHENFSEMNIWTFDTVRNGHLRFKKHQNEKRYTYLGADMSPEVLLPWYMSQVNIDPTPWPYPHEFEPLFQEEAAKRTHKHRADETSGFDLFSHIFLGERKYPKKPRHNRHK
jgi:hypothetical protein